MNTKNVFSNKVLLAGAVATSLSMTALLPVEASASTLVVDRGLPTDNLNNSSGSNRSNVAWADESGWLADTFSLAMDATIDQLTAWVITSSSIGSDFGDTFSNLSLYLGSAAGTEVDKVASANFSGNASDNANVSVTAVTYDNSDGYQGSSGSFLQIWAVNFLNLGAYTAGDYVFSLTGLTDEYYTFVHASNADLGGAQADGADDLMYIFSGANGASSLTYSSDYDSNGDGWDKSSDLNVQVYTSPVPLPASLPLLVGAFSAIGGISVLRRRRQSKVA